MKRCTAVPSARPHRLRRLVVPVALTVVALAVSAVSTGCGNDTPRPDAGGDAAPDTPIV